MISVEEWIGAFAVVLGVVWLVWYLTWERDDEPAM